ncbi:hypothetical protein HY406_00855 [Candidatus Giovannonibacteria bacterium]|nr:hypothetical protein [Candidatus Giovannonibacteria bacterium]
MATTLGDGAIARLRELAHKKIEGALAKHEERDFETLFEAAPDSIKGEILTLLRYDGTD